MSNTKITAANVAGLLADRVSDTGSVDIGGKKLWYWANDKVGGQCLGEIDDEGHPDSVWRAVAMFFHERQAKR